LPLTKSQTATNAVSYLGKTLTLTDGTAALIGGQAQWTYTVPSTAATTKLLITGLRRATPSTPATARQDRGSHVFAWDGKNAAGAQVPDGTYKLKVIAAGADGSTIDSHVSSQGNIGEVDLSGSEPTLIIGTMRVPLSQAIHISGQ
jgi:flagellar basal-body rod modification protein FlgD